MFSYRSFRTLLLGALAIATLGLAPPAAAQVGDPHGSDLHPTRRPSPLGMARTHIGDAYVFVVYGRPYERGRENVFGPADSGALVPFGKIWRTGANEASQITLTEDLVVGTETLPAGTYSLFTTPGAEEWTIHFNRALGLSGTARYNPETEEFEEGYTPDDDVLVVSAKPSKLDEKVEQLTIGFETTETGSDLVLEWIDTAVRVPVRRAG